MLSERVKFGETPQDRPGALLVNPCHRVTNHFVIGHGILHLKLARFGNFLRNLTLPSCIVTLSTKLVDLLDEVLLGIVCTFSQINIDLVINGKSFVRLVDFTSSANLLLLTCLAAITPHARVDVILLHRVVLVVIVWHLHWLLLHQICAFCPKTHWVLFLLLRVCVGICFSSLWLVLAFFVCVVEEVT